MADKSNMIREAAKEYLADPEKYEMSFVDCLHYFADDASSEELNEIAKAITNAPQTN